MNPTLLPAILAAVLCAAESFPISNLHAEPVEGWLSWRGPTQNGFAPDRGLPEQLSLADVLWTADFPGQSTPVIANGRLFIMGYEGDGPNLQEGVACFDAETGKKLWERLYNDFLSDIIYHRYATSSAAIDPETGNVFMQGTQGIVAGFTLEGKPLWDLSMMERFGRLTFPNGRTASPVVDKDLIITRGITANWGAQGPAADRFYAFDKATGDLVWASTPGDRPRDNSFSHPVLAWYQGKRVFYAATGDGSVVCVNARTGDPIWRIPIFKAGINSSLLLYKNERIIAIYGTPYEPGQMLALKIPQVTPGQPGGEPVVVERSAVELWNNDLRTSTSSPILVGNRVYLTSEVGNLVSVNADTGKTLWKLKIGIEQRSASPLFADGRLYVPMLNEPGGKEESAGEAAGGHGAFYVLEPSDAGAKVISHLVLDGRCYGSPTPYNGNLYLQTSLKIYCFGNKGNHPGVAKASAEELWPAAGEGAQLQVIPSEVLLMPGEKVAFRTRVLDKNGFLVEEVKGAKAVQWRHYVPPTARVRSAMAADFNRANELVASHNAKPSAGAFEAEYHGFKGHMRGRVLTGLPIREDFESFQLSNTTTNEVEPPTAFAYPPLPWIGARFKFEVREKDGNKVLAKTIDNRFFQRATVFIGGPQLKDYTVEADVMSEGNRYKMSDVGLVAQRYYVLLKGNQRVLEINSNQELFRYTAPFSWLPNQWYHLKARVDAAPDGSGVVRAKAWKKGEAEPEKWTLEVPHAHAHQNGSPGLFGFSPQDMRVFIDNISVSSNSPQ